MFKMFGLGKKNEETSPPVSPAEQGGAQPPLETGNDASGLGKLRSAVSMTGKALIDRIVSLGRTDEAPLTEEALEEIEETLIRADVGVDMAVDLTEKIRKNPGVHQPEKLKMFLKEEFSRTLAEIPNAHQLCYKDGKLNIYLVVGVNGAGKTTLIGKLAHRFVQSGKRVVIGAGDTFRAAAEDQLEIWAKRSGAELVRKDNADAAAVIFDSLQEAKAQHADVLILDTAGRLQNKFNLMEELRKIKRIIEREAPPESVYESLLVIDATTGQNAMRQAEVFKEAVELTGVALTKLDSSAKGGIVFNVAKEYRLPVKLVGVGEKIEDLRDFEPQVFIDALFEK